MKNIGKVKMRLKRATALTIAFMVVANMLPWNAINELMPEFDIDWSFITDKLGDVELPKLPDSLVNPRVVHAKEPGDYTTTSTFTTWADFFEYCDYYQTDASFASAHQNDRLIFTLTGEQASTRDIVGSSYPGLGTSASPFAGTIVLPDSGAGNYTLTFKGAPLFDYVADCAKIVGQNNDNALRLGVIRDGNAKVLFANHVKHVSGTGAIWEVGLDSSNSSDYSGVIGEILSGATVTLDFENNSSAGVSSSSDVGTICGVIEGGATLNLDYSGSASGYSIMSSSGNAGGLIGDIQGDAVVNFNTLPSLNFDVSTTNNEKHAGGIAGKCTSRATISYPSSAFPGCEGSVKSHDNGYGAGGLFGYYVNKDNSGVIDLTDYPGVEMAVDGKYCGGLIGFLKNEGDSLTIKGDGTSSTAISTVSKTSGSASGYFGGIIGRYDTNALANTLTIKDAKIVAESKSSFRAFGGVIGMVADTAAYIKVDNVVVSAKGTDKRTDYDSTTGYSYFGGLIGAIPGDHGVLVNLGDFTLNTNESFCGGGVIGYFKTGVLRLRETTDMTGAKPAGSFATSNDDAYKYASYGQLVGSNDNVLVYALGNGNDSGWTFKRSKNAKSDDLGTWGEVVRINDIESDVLTYDSSAHTVTIKAAVTNISNKADFVRTALNIMLHNASGYDCLLFSGSDRDALLSGTLSIGADINLSGTGVNGFMRDGVGIEKSGDNVVSKMTASSIGGVGTFTGTLNGGGHTITLATGEAYGDIQSGSDEGTGFIYRHQYNGLFSVVGNGASGTGTINNLTVAGTIYVRNAGADGMNIGGIAARSHGSTTLNNVSVSGLTIKYHEGAKSPASGNLGKNIGGFIGYADEHSSDNGTIAISGASDTSPSIFFSGHHENWNVYGGVIGKVASKKIQIDIGKNSSDKLTVGLNVDISGVTNTGDDANGGGLIGYIISNGSYSTRKINIDNTDFVDCVIGNASSAAGGGFLGHIWLNTTTTIKGVEVKGNSTINNTAGSVTATDVGVMCYSATGKWIVDSITVTKMEMNNGASASIGMIVNKAYEGNDGLYLDVLNSGYSLVESGITIPTTTTYDEISAHSASNVLNGGSGAGVVSIDMNSSRSETAVKTTVTGTYQNQISSMSSNFANDKTRYYYNLNHMVTSDAGQNLVLWSVKKYAATNISGEFSTTLGTTLSGDADLTGLSFYPVKNASDYTIGNLTLTFGYSGIYQTAETVSNGDSYIRDPGAKNQHYLMHSGLFMNLPKDKTINVTGKLTLKGTFLELGGSNGASDGYSGVIISKTMNGSFKCESGQIELAGITPKTTANAAYNSGYLLINNIKRESDTDSVPKIIINNLYTGSGYTGTLPVASSLLGAAEGNDLTIKFSHIRLDARTTALSGNTGLNTAYNTTRSIFKDAVFLKSIKTNSTAILEYYYTYAEDWGGNADRFVTYGKEVKDTIEYKEGGVSLENMYSGADRRYTNPVSSAQLTTEYNFSSGWLRYVNTQYTSASDTEKYYRELKVNVEKFGPQTGCGTYNHPYVLDSNSLVVIAKFISSGSASDMQKIRLPKDSSKYNSLAKNSSGNRWCDDCSACATFELSTSGTNSGKYVYEDDSTAYVWEASNVRLYLANAYYKVGSNITLGSNFVGLGCSTSSATGDYAFRGVIVGEKTSDSDSAPKWTITNKSANPLVKVSNGSVIKDVNITVDVGTITLSQSNATYNGAYFGYDSKCQYYGGIIGEVMGGDNIIDNSYVRYSYTDASSNNHITKIKLAGGYGTIVPVGGYVGVVVFGGVIFKNMDATKTGLTSTGLNVYYNSNTDNLANNENQSAWAAIYVNPIVGRVINGYAVNETASSFSITEKSFYHDNETARSGDKHTLKNGTKHYSIADINKNEEKKLSVTPPSSASSDGTINIPNSQAFFILSLITQSCAGTAQAADGDYQKSLSYGTNTTVYGMSHIADYSDVGKDGITKNSNDDFGKASSDTAANTAVPYIIRWYTVNSSGNYPARCVTSTKGYYDINLTAKTEYSTDAYTYQLPDSFRGLGSIGNYDTYYPTNNKGTNNEGQNNSTVFADRAKNEFCLKVDIFNGNACTIDEDIYLNKYQSDNYLNVMHKGTNQSVSENIQGYEPNTRKNNHGIGLFDSVILNDANSKITDFTLTGSVLTEIYNNTYMTTKNDQIIKGINSSNLWLSVGGVVGWATNGTCLKFEKIHLDDLSISGSSHIGGLLGFSGLSSTVLKIVVSECSADDISVDMTSAKTNESQQKSRNAIGTLVGKAYEAAVVIYGASDGADNSDLTKYSEVKIKAFSFGKAGEQYTVASGGLVGFAGHCCQIYDMKISSADDTVTIGNSKVSFSGGIVGCMQSVTDKVDETTCIALFKNCIVENINVVGEYAGGFYGGKWDSAWTPYSITLDNCKVLGKSSTEKNTITATRIAYNPCAGGFVGRGLVKTSAATNQNNILIKDCLVSNYIITAVGGTSDSEKGVAGGFVGYCSSNANNSTITCYIHDSSVENCIIGASGNYNFGGGAIGWVNPKNANYANKMLGYNIKLDNVTSNNNNTMGAWVGYLNSSDNKTSIQFSGMAIYENGFVKNIGNGRTLNSASFVFADYSGACKTGTTEIQSGFDYDINTHVKMPLYPYINVNPQSKMGANEVISGDGAVLRSSAATGFSGYTASKTMSAKIFADISEGTDSRRYTTFGDFNNTTDAIISGGNKIDAYMRRTKDIDGDRISTYQTEKGSLPGNGNVDDFACIVIANTDNTETTKLINNYIRLVTNTTTDYTASSDYYSIDIKKCVFSNTNNRFEVSNDTNVGLRFNSSDHQFEIVSENADSLASNHSFTLVDVQFKDPFDNDMIAYHLYVPVYTIKPMTYNFYTTAVTGTNPVQYNASTGAITGSVYESSLVESTAAQFHIDSIKEWITEYFRFEYNATDIKTLIDSGDLNWNFDKKIKMTVMQNSHMLTDQTYMILVDPNANSDKQYVANGSAITLVSGNDYTLDFSAFMLARDGTTSFTEKHLRDIIAGSIEATSSTGTGKYDLTDSSHASDPGVIYVLSANGTKRYYAYNSAGTGDYDIDFKSGVTTVKEDYYLSFWVPDISGNNDQIYFYNVSAVDILVGNKTAKLDHYNNLNMLVADLYEQETSTHYVVGPSQQQITQSNNVLTAEMMTTITLKNTMLRSYVANAQLYHSFDISLNRYTAGGNVNNTIAGLDTVTAKYDISTSSGASWVTPTTTTSNIDIGDNYINVETADIASRFSSSNEVTVYGKVTMTFDDIVSEFPEASSASSGIGINVAATSNLAYDEASLAFSSMTESFPHDSKYYYRETTSKATLDYSALDELDVYETYGRLSNNFSRQGINGSYTQSGMEVNTGAYYNVAAINNAGDADYVRLTLNLSKKTDSTSGGTVTGASYQSISNISNYMTILAITSGSSADLKSYKNTSLSTNGTYVYDIPINLCYKDAGDNYQFVISFRAVTGGSFTEYANYKIPLRAELIDSAGGSMAVIEGSPAEDYVVYTNAKVEPEVIQDVQ